MSAGASARHEAERARLRAEALDREIKAELHRARCFDVAGRTEALVASLLRPLSALGWRLLEDRRWPGTARSNIDLLAVGPGGVLVIDVKCWAEVTIDGGRLFRGQDDASDELDKLLRQVEVVTEAVAGVGVVPTAVLPVMVFVGQRGTANVGRVHILDEGSLTSWILRRPSRLGDEQVDAIWSTLDAAIPRWDAPAVIEPPSLVVPEPVMPLARHASVEPEPLFDVEEITAALVEQALALPLEDWMTFLHPDQLRLVRRSSNGPWRIRGAAGTGKTVVGLHRAAFLAESTSGLILFTTFVRTLPPVLSSLYARLSPHTSERVIFTNLHKWAKDFLEARGHRVTIEPSLGAAFSAAWTKCGANSSLAELCADKNYWQDEIHHVIKGRGIVDFSSYEALPRTGRRTRLTRSQRELVWTLYEEYERLLRQGGTHDFNDVLSLALAEVKAQPLDRPFTAVIADEVQDLNCVGVRLLDALAADSGQLLLIGDGQQQIYPGGYTLAEAGISVAGRATVLQINYRNADAIVQAATDVVAKDGWQDLEGEPQSGTREVKTARQGGQVWRQPMACIDDVRAGAVRHVRDLIARGQDIAGIAVLCTSNYEVKRYQQLLRHAAIRWITLDDYDGTPVDAVKVGTVHRAKGLEFKHVVHPMNARTQKAMSAEARREEDELAHRAQFVAMTRARDTLWVGYVG